MKLITRDTDYAIRALCYIAKKNKEIVTSGELVSELNIPRPFLRKLLQILNKNKVLISYKGKGGGFILNKPADRIFVIDLITIFQGALSLNECFFRKELCSRRNSCTLRKKIRVIEKNMLSEIKNITLASLLP